MRAEISAEGVWNQVTNLFSVERNLFFFFFLVILEILELKYIHKIW